MMLKDNDFPAELRSRAATQAEAEAVIMDEPVTATDEEDKAALPGQLAMDKDHPAHGLDTEEDEDE